MSLTSLNVASRRVVAVAAGVPPVSVLLRLEALTVLAAGLAAFAYLEISWWWFAALILVPDLSAIGYAGGSKLGAWCYDLVHTYVGPAALVVIGYLIHDAMVMAVAAVWFSHIGFDRLIGYGLKFAGNPRDRHLSRVAAKLH
ncbi:MAG: DUF4260 domain-containing protein [Devosia sp.]